MPGHGWLLAMDGITRASAASAPAWMPVSRSHRVAMDGGPAASLMPLRQEQLTDRASASMIAVVDARITFIRLPWMVAFVPVEPFVNQGLVLLHGRLLAVAGS
jgi:hypothetical protein